MPAAVPGMDDAAARILAPRLLYADHDRVYEHAGLVVDKKRERNDDRRVRPRARPDGRRRRRLAAERYVRRLAGLMRRHSASVELALPADALWRSVCRLDGVNYELGPILRMTVPRGLGASSDR